MTNQEIEKLKNRKFETEDQFQVATNLLISQNFPKLRGKYWHTKNEGWKRRAAIFDSKTNDWRIETEQEHKERCIREGAQDKAKGLKAGVMDWLFVHNGILYKLELKIEGGNLSDSQKELIILFNKDCPEIPVVVAYNLYDVYMFCKWICETNLKISFPENYSQYSL